MRKVMFATLALTLALALRYMPMAIEGSMEVAANQQRRSLPPLPSASPHQNPWLLPRLASCVAFITHYPSYLHLDLKEQM
jgi:hypothetical protein